jgi:hypothetical protein
MTTTLVAPGTYKLLLGIGVGVAAVALIALLIVLRRRARIPAAELAPARHRLQPSS